MQLQTLLTIAAICVTCALGAVIVPGATWTDTSGDVIQAHGGGFLKVRIFTDSFLQRHSSSQVGSMFYWFGEDKSHNSVLFKAVSCYSVCNSRQSIHISYIFSLSIWFRGHAKMMH